MKLFIDRDYFSNPIPPSVYLCNTSKKIIGELPAYEISGTFKWNTYSEIRFSVDRTYVDILTGDTKVNPLFDKVESPRNIYVKNIGYFTLQDIDTSYADKDTKTATAFSLEYSTLGTKYLTNFKINNGEVDSKEVIYLASIYGEAYSPSGDNQYTRVSGAFDPYESYYIKDYTDNNSYTWQRVEVKNESDYSTYDGTTVAKTLYVQKYPRIRFYHPTNKQLSLVHLILENAPEWTIGHVDAALWRKERSFDESRVAIYDFLNSTVAETFGCVVEFDTLTSTINFYEELDDGLTEDNSVATRWETDVVVSRENLANEINISYSSDNIKTKLTVSGSDDLNISEVNVGRNEIMNLNFYHTLDWMEQDLFDAYSTYLRAIQEAETGLDQYGLPSTMYPMSYSDAVNKWVAAYNRWNDLMNTVPAENDAVLIGDEFKKLYCMYTPISTAFVPTTISYVSPTTEFDVLYSDPNYTVAINKSDLSENDTFIVQGHSYLYKSGKFVYNGSVSTTTSLNALTKKLNDYFVDEDIDGNKNDNILLKLKNANSDVATIRIYDPKRKADAIYDPSKSYYKQKKNAAGYEKVYITNAEQFAQSYNDLYTNNYTIQSVVVRADSGIEGAPSYWSMTNENISTATKPFTEWVKGNLTAESMGLEGYTVSYIGTMGAYLVIAENEFSVVNNELVPSKDYLRNYGVNLLKEKHATYTKIFQAQTEAMYSQEKYQCVASAEPPDGDIPENTRWFDTDSNPPMLYKWSEQKWISIQNDANEADLKNYQRYIDNYKKLQAVQEVLLEKERDAEYCLNGYEVQDRKININSSTLENDMRKVAEAHLKELSEITGKTYSIIRVALNANLPLYTFMTSFDATHTFAVYLNGSKPYVAYADSRGVYQMIRDYIKNKTDISNFFTEDQWIRLSPFIREDEFNDPNFLLTGYESEEERMQISKELMEAAVKELNTLSQPSLEFSMTMANILAIPEFEPLIGQFNLGNFIRVHIRDDYVKRARLLEVNLSFHNLSDFNVTFGNLVTTKSEVDKHAELLSQAITAGKQVATAAGTWQRSVDKTNKLEEAIESGLQDASLQVGRASGQALTWDANGFYCRKFVDGTTDQYENEQIAIINNKIVFTNDGWKTSQAALGEFLIDTNGDNIKEKYYGLIAQAVVSGFIKGSTIEGGSLKIGGTGGTFIVNEDGSVQILGPDASTPVYATKDEVALINQAGQYYTELEYTGSTVFTEPGQSCMIKCKVLNSGVEITNLPSGTIYKWVRNSNVDDTSWNNSHTYTDINTITITNEDIEKNAQFYCQCTLDETKLS